MGDEGVDLLERALVQEDGEALARGELAALVLGLDSVLSAALRGCLLALSEIREAILRGVAGS